MLSYMAITGDSAEKNTPAKQETEGQCLGQEDPLKKEIAMGYSILAWEIPMDRGAWQATVRGVVKESDVTLATKQMWGFSSLTKY